MLKNNIVILFSIIVLLLTSCRSATVIKYKKKIHNIPDVKLRSHLKDNQLQFNKLYLKKVNVTVNNGNDKKSFKGSFVIAKDSVMIASVFAPMGIELIRAKFTNDSIIVIDKHKKNVYKLDYSFFLIKYGVDIDFKMLQAILSNSLFIYPSLNNDYFNELKKYKNELDSNYYRFKSLKDKRLIRKSRKGAKQLVVHDISIYPEIFRIFKVFIKDFSLNRTLEVEYKNFKKYNQVLFPENFEIVGSKGNSKLNVQLKIGYISVNNGGSLYFKIPSSYEVKDL